MRVNTLGDRNSFADIQGIGAKYRPQHICSLFTGKDPDAGKDRCQEENGMTEDEIVGWHH